MEEKEEKKVIKKNKATIPTDDSMLKNNKQRVSIFKMPIDLEEIKISDEKQGYTNIDSIIAKFQRGHYGEREELILKYIAEFKFLTSRQLNQLLAQDNLDFKAPRKLALKLEQLLKDKLIVAFHFETLEEKANYRVYGLNKNGKYILDGKSYVTNWKPTDNLLDICGIKKNLAANQMLLAYLMKSKNNKGIIPRKSVNILSGRLEFNGIIEQGNNLAKIPIIVETVRREKNWEKNFSKRLKKIKEFFDDFENVESGFNEIPFLVFLCEDDKHIIETYKQIVLNNFEIMKKPYFTHDVLQLNEELQTTWCEFIEENGKIKKQELNIPILK